MNKISFSGIRSWRVWMYSGGYWFVVLFILWGLLRNALRDTEVHSRLVDALTGILGAYAAVVALALNAFDILLYFLAGIIVQFIFRSNGISVSLLVCLFEIISRITIRIFFLGDILGFTKYWLDTGIYHFVAPMFIVLGSYAVLRLQGFASRLRAHTGEGR